MPKLIISLIFAVPIVSLVLLSSGIIGLMPFCYRRKNKKTRRIKKEVK